MTTNIFSTIGIERKAQDFPQKWRLGHLRQQAIDFIMFQEKDSIQCVVPERKPPDFTP